MVRSQRTIDSIVDDLEETHLWKTSRRHQLGRTLLEALEVGDPYHPIPLDEKIQFSEELVWDHPDKKREEEKRRFNDFATGCLWWAISKSYSKKRDDIWYDRMVESCFNLYGEYDWFIRDNYVWCTAHAGRNKKAYQNFQQYIEPRYSNNQLEMLEYFECEFRTQLLNSTRIISFAGAGNHLSDYGRRNEPEIATLAKEKLYDLVELSAFELVYENFWDQRKNRMIKATVAQQILEPIAELTKGAYGDRCRKWAKNYAVDNALKSGRLSQGYGFLLDVLRILLNIAEDEHRHGAGIKSIGESWVSETELYNLVSKSLPEYEVVQHGRPEWLGRQHFDIWIPELNVAIEYQGAQHDQPVELFGGEEGYRKTQERDQRKKKKAMKHGCRLIEVRPGYDLGQVLREICG